VYWQPFEPTVTWLVSPTQRLGGAIYVQYRDLAGNVSEIYSGTFAGVTPLPNIQAEASSGDSFTRTITFSADDGLLTKKGILRLSNDPLMLEDVVTLPYTITRRQGFYLFIGEVIWTFDERQVVWVQVEDSVGNSSEPFPVFAGGGNQIYLPFVRR
jgi:hypothetical protein